MSNAKIVTQSDWDQEVLKSATPVLVDFYAEWCGPCRMMGPVLDNVSQKMGDKVKILKLNSDNDQGIAAQYAISSIPCLILFKNEQECDRLVGYNSEPQLIQWLNSKI